MNALRRGSPLSGPASAKPRAATFACLLLCTGALSASVPAPEPVRTVSLIPKLEGTTWSGDGVVAPTTYFFDKNGVLQYSYNGNTYRNGTWKQEGESLYWESNQKYCEFKGKIEAAEIVGNAWNVRGGKWVLKFKPQNTR
jgi:hypothetical protein